MPDSVGVRRGTIASYPVVIIDGLMSITEASRLFGWLEGAPFTRTEVARPDTQAFRHWVYNVEPSEYDGLALYRRTLDAVLDHFPERGEHRCYRAYCNQSSYGDMLFTHTDSQPGNAEVTALWYIAPRWDPEWGGETLFYTEAGDAEFVVSPRPGRLVLFDGRIRHAGRPPSRVCAIPRLTFALKLEPVAG